MKPSEILIAAKDHLCGGAGWPSKAMFICHAVNAARDDMLEMGLTEAYDVATKVRENIEMIIGEGNTFGSLVESLGIIKCVNKRAMQAARLNFMNKMIADYQDNGE